ncbi:glycerate kinase [Pseudonocardia bannensis]|uniref:Glycerate kinase n=1 Tax=Pseudonocardia bannensis TaxID=630973 RepID=A0A848DDQ5_9PSEU|nr:glycerate kinase [Pseudonocardia bannensis]NMH90740.1 glycerate kinase [Pseudonocardia bannensis]
MRVVVAPDKFKGSLSAPEVAAAVADGLRRGDPGVEVVCTPVADGGEGTVDAALAAGWSPVPVDATGPTGEPVRATYAVRDGTALVELADVVGLRRLPAGRPAPLTATTAGLGTVVRHAVEHGARRVVLAVGGSASTDGGAGLLRALGARLLDARGAPLPDGGAALRELAALDLAGLHSGLAGVDVVVASDVDNPLLGAGGTAAVYGPQKGASEADVAVLGQGLERWASVVAAVTGRDLAGAPGAGAAGGCAFAAMAVLGAEIRPGIGLMLDLVGFAGAVAGADLVVTGEGSLDEQSLHGKAPVGVARAAAAAGVPVVAVAGRCLLDHDRLRAAGIIAAYPLTSLQPDPRRCMSEAAGLLVQVGERIAVDRLAPGSGAAGADAPAGPRQERTAPPGPDVERAGSAAGHGRPTGAPVPGGGDGAGRSPVDDRS